MAPIEYGEPDLPPFIEGYLAMACRESGRDTRAEDMRKQFMVKSGDLLWMNDEAVGPLREEINQLFGMQPAATGQAVE